MKSKIKLPNKLTVGTDTDIIFNDADFCSNLVDNLRQAKTVRTTHKKTKTELFYTKTPNTTLYKFRQNGQLLISSQLSLSRCPSLTKSQRRLQEREPKTKSNNVSKEYLEIKKSQTEQDIVPIQLLFEQNSFLARNHELLIDSITELSESVKVQLLSNQYEIQRWKEEKIQSNLDSKLLFILYNTMQQLDKKIIGSIFNKQQTPAENFKLKNLSDTMEMVSEMVTLLIKYISRMDIKLATFVEYFWKFWVVLIDVAMQWMDKSCTDYIEYQISQFKQQFEEAIHQKNITEDKLIRAEKEFKLQEQQYQRKCDSLETQILSIQSEFNEYKQAMLQMSDLKQAEKRMNAVGLKSLELENLFKQYDRQLFDYKSDFQKDFKQLGSILVQQKKLQEDLKQPHQQAQSILHIHQYVENKTLYELFTNMHPFCLHFKKIELHEQDDENDYDTQLIQFLEYLTNYDDLMQNVCLIFREWVNDSDRLNRILNHLLTQRDYTQHSLHHFYCILFGLKNNQQISWISISNLICYFKQLRQELHQQLNEAIYLKDSNYILDLILPEEFMEIIKHHKLDSITILSLLNLLAQFMQQTENKQWNRWKFHFKIDSDEFDHNKLDYFLQLKIYLNQGELNIQQKNDYFDQIRHLSLMYPSLFYKHKQMISKMQTQIRRVSQKNTAQQQQKDNNTRPSQMKRQSTYNGMIKSQVLRK
ncbi:unnamed protein product [Paramecium sonneborni]|uniref:Uncharacterized protein n=1 Tax=Paramecium sonneborni TaxID=65129 RepID=A0A8S1R9T1_9CILI|nr:unnamed protein product [Paramecium sonneborni]